MVNIQEHLANHKALFCEQMSQNSNILHPSHQPTTHLLTL